VIGGAVRNERRRRRDERRRRPRLERCTKADKKTNEKLGVHVSAYRLISIAQRKIFREKTNVPEGGAVLPPYSRRESIETPDSQEQELRALTTNADLEGASAVVIKLHETRQKPLQLGRRIPVISKAVRRERARRENERGNRQQEEEQLQ
jgi:hypothetical protein